MTPWYVKAFWWIVGIWAAMVFFNAFGDAFNDPSGTPSYYYDNQERDRDWCGSVPC